MKQVNRRDAVKLGAALAMGVGTAAECFAADEPKAGDGQIVDRGLERALKSPSTYMFGEQMTFELAGDGHSRELFFTSARDMQGQKVKVRVPSMCTRVFRADSGQDEFTTQGGVYWTFWKAGGKIQFKQPGALV